MNKIGIIGALDEELEIIKSEMKNVSVKKAAGIDFFSGAIHGKSVVLARCGVGKVNAAVCTQALIDLFKPDCIINTGVAGAIHDGLDIGDIVISKDLVTHDFNAEPIIPDYKIPERYVPADGVLVAKASEAAATIQKKGLTIHTGRIATGDSFINESEIKNKLWTDFEALCVEMEGASIAHACWLNEIPFVIVRAISDKADEEAKVSFEKFVVDASKNSCAMIFEMLRII